MPILNYKQLEYNSRIKINFDGGDLSSDTGLLLIKEFINKIGFEKSLLPKLFLWEKYIVLITESGSIKQ